MSVLEYHCRPLMQLSDDVRAEIPVSSSASVTQPRRYTQKYNIDALHCHYSIMFRILRNWTRQSPSTSKSSHSIACSGNTHSYLSPTNNPCPVSYNEMISCLVGIFFLVTVTAISLWLDLNETESLTNKDHLIVHCSSFQRDHHHAHFLQQSTDNASAFLRESEFKKTDGGSTKVKLPDTWCD